MNLCGGKFVPSDVRATAKASATKWSAIDDFEPGALNEEELAWAAKDPELAKLLAMCSQKELERMREDRAYKAARAQ